MARPRAPASPPPAPPSPRYQILCAYRVTPHAAQICVPASSAIIVRYRPAHPPGARHAAPRCAPKNAQAPVARPPRWSTTAGLRPPGWRRRRDLVYDLDRRKPPAGRSHRQAYPTSLFAPAMQLIGIRLVPKRDIRNARAPARNSLRQAAASQRSSHSHQRCRPTKTVPVVMRASLIPQLLSKLPTHDNPPRRAGLVGRLPSSQPRQLHRSRGSQICVATRASSGRGGNGPANANEDLWSSGRWDYSKMGSTGRCEFRASLRCRESTQRSARKDSDLLLNRHQPNRSRPFSRRCRHWIRNFRQSKISGEPVNERWVSCSTPMSSRTSCDRRR